MSFRNPQIGQHQRDGLAAMGCLVSDWVEDMDRGLITPGEDCLTFRDTKELRESVQMLLDDSGQRNGIREQGHATFLERHTPAHRAGEMLGIVRKA